MQSSYNLYLALAWIKKKTFFNFQVLVDDRRLLIEEDGLE